MANYAYVEYDQIVSVYDNLPKNWRNISNFYALSDWNYLNSIGWYELIKIIPQYNSNTHKLDNPSHYFLDGRAYENYELVPLPPPKSLELIIQEKWNEIRQERERLMNDFEWRYTRYEREIRLGLPLTNDLQSMDDYMQSLADITQQPDPFAIQWPTFLGE